jgi:L-fucose isomerase-like protein
MSIENHALVPRVGVGSLCSPLEVGADRAPQAATNLAHLLRAAGCEVIELSAVDRPEKAAAAGRKAAEAHVHAMALVATSWFEDYLVFDLLEECGVPSLLWSLPGMETGALCGVQQLAACLKQLSTPYRALYGPLDSPECGQSAQAFLRAAGLRYRLRRAKLGLAGHRVNGMSEVAVDEMALKRIFGPRIVPLDLPQLLADAQNVSDAEAKTAWQVIVGRAAACNVSEAEGIDSIKIHAAVRRLVDRYALDALTIGCYPHLMGRVCLGASLLADEGIPMACEGDLAGALGQLILTLLTGQPTHNTDWLDPLDNDTVVLSHCGAGSFSLAATPGEVQLASVRLMGQGVCVLFTAKPGPVTMVNIIPRHGGYQMALVEGEALSTSMVFPGNPLRVGFGCPMSEMLDWIIEEGIGHHWMAGYGHVGEELHQWAKMAPADLHLIEKRI